MEPVNASAAFQQIAMDDRALPAADAASPSTRCSILRIAERLFREIGYRKTTVADIAKALRMSPANVYRFFDSKKAINEAVAERLMADSEAELRAIATDAGLTSEERLRSFALVMSRLSRERFTAERRVHEMVEVAMTESWEVIHRHIARVDEMLCGIMVEGVDRGEFRAADPMVAARCVHAALIRFVHPSLIVQCAEEPGPTVEEMIEFLLAALRPAPHAADRRETLRDH